jgi:hypothetical protein
VYHFILGDCPGFSNNRTELATTGVDWLTGLPLVGAQILAVLLARSSSDETRLRSSRSGSSGRT